MFFAVLFNAVLCSAFSWVYAVINASLRNCRLKTLTPCTWPHLEWDIIQSGDTSSHRLHHILQKRHRTERGHKLSFSLSRVSTRQNTNWSLKQDAQIYTRIQVSSKLGMLDNCSCLQTCIWRIAHYLSLVWSSFEKQETSADKSGFDSWNKKCHGRF